MHWSVRVIVAQLAVIVPWVWFLVAIHSPKGSINAAVILVILITVPSFAVFGLMTKLFGRRRCPKCGERV